MKLKGILLIGLSLVSIVVFAAEQIAKEETNSPPPEGAITVDQISPVFSPSSAPKPQELTLPPAPVGAVSIETAPTNTITADAHPPVPATKPAVGPISPSSAPSTGNLPSTSNVPTQNATK